MDELFTLALLGSPVDLVRAYWELSQPKNSSHFMVLTQSHTSERMQTLIAKNVTNNYDMDIIDTAFVSSCMVLPHRPYALLTGEFFHTDQEHVKYIGNDEEKWDGGKVLQEAKMVHFSDWPIPKPWVGLKGEWLESET